MVCPKPIASNITSVGRGAAVSEFVNGDVLLCGGRDTNNRVLNTCMGYHMSSNNWESHSLLIDYREESASVVVAGQVHPIEKKEA